MATQSFEVIGGQPLNGSIVPQGAKNEALQVISAVLLTQDTVTISNIPDILDVQKLIDLLRSINVQVQRLSSDTYSFQAAHIDTAYLESADYRRQVGKLRGSVMLLGPTLARFGRSHLPQPGGDKIGRRRLDTHLLGIEKLGATFTYNPELKGFTVDAPSLQGTYILMDEISVTGTANVVMAAVLAHGTTQIYNAACEPYVQQLCRMLNQMGAKITGIGSNLLTIEGVTTLHGTTHRVLPDMIEIGSFIGLAAMTQSNLTIKNCHIPELGNIPTVFKRFGVAMNFIGDDIHIPPQSQYEIQSFMDGSIMTVYDAPWPGFTPDLISILVVLATQARGSVLIHQKMFESRLFFVDKLIDMGAQIILCDPHRATVIGLNRQFPLRGIEMTSPDIRDRKSVV